MDHHSFDGLSFVDAQGTYRLIYGCPLKQRRELAHALTTLNERLKASKIQTISDMYDHDPEFQAIADHALTLCRIDPNWLTIEMMIEFLLPHRGKDGTPTRALLEQINFPKVISPDEPTGTHADAVAALWSHTQDLEQALRLAGYDQSSPAWDELSEILKARMAQTPEGKEQREMAEIARDLEARVKDGLFASEMAIASPSETEQLLRMI